MINVSDYRSENTSLKYMLQTNHMTKVYHYNDTQNWLVSEGKLEKGSTVVKV